MSMFPLINESLDAVTVPSHSARARGISWKWSDSIRSQAPVCAADASMIVLDVEVTNNGENTDCVWFVPADTYDPCDPPKSPARQILMRHKMVGVSLDPVPGSVDQYALSIEANGTSRTDTSGRSRLSMTDGRPNDEQWHFVCLTTTTICGSSFIDMYLDARHVQTVSGQGDLYDGVAKSSEVSLCPLIQWAGGALHRVRKGAHSRGDPVAVRHVRGVWHHPGHPELGAMNTRMAGSPEAPSLAS